jgi:hypothetical protein
MLSSQSYLLTGFRMEWSSHDNIESYQRYCGISDVLNARETCLHRMRVLVALIRLTSLDFIDTLSAPGPLPNAVPS